MFRPTMLRYAALTCSDRFARALRQSVVSTKNRTHRDIETCLALQKFETLRQLCENLRQRDARNCWKTRLRDPLNANKILVWPGGFVAIQVHPKSWLSKLKMDSVRPRHYISTILSQPVAYSICLVSIMPNKLKIYLALNGGNPERSW